MLSFIKTSLLIRASQENPFHISHNGLELRRWRPSLEIGKTWRPTSVIIHLSRQKSTRIFWLPHWRAWRVPVGALNRWVNFRL